MKMSHFFAIMCLGLSFADMFAPPEGGPVGYEPVEPIFYGVPKIIPFDPNPKKPDPLSHDPRTLPHPVVVKGPDNPPAPFPPIHGTTPKQPVDLIPTPPHASPIITQGNQLTPIDHQPTKKPSGGTTDNDNQAQNILGSLQPNGGIPNTNTGGSSSSMPYLVGLQINNYATEIKERAKKYVVALKNGQLELDEALLVKKALELVLDEMKKLQQAMLNNSATSPSLNNAAAAKITLAESFIVEFERLINEKFPKTPVPREQVPTVAPSPLAKKITYWRSVIAQYISQDKRKRTHLSATISQFGRAAQTQQGLARSLLKEVKKNELDQDQFLALQNRERALTQLQKKLQEAQISCTELLTKYKTTLSDVTTTQAKDALQDEQEWLQDQISTLTDEQLSAQESLKIVNTNLAAVQAVLPSKGVVSS